MEFEATRFFTSATLKKLVQEYLPEEFVSPNWSCHGNDHVKNLQNLLDSSCGKLRMYPSAHDLLDELKSFGSYPGAFAHIEAPITDHYVNGVHFHPDFRKEFYIYRKDSYACLFQCFLMSSFKMNEHKEHILIKGLLAFYVRSLDFKHQFNAEIVHFPRNEFDILYKAAFDFARKFRNTPASNELDLTDGQMVEKWRSLINLDVSDKFCREEFEKFLQRAVSDMPFNGNQKFWSKAFEWVETAITDCNGFIKTHERQFLPRSCLESDGSKALVRLLTAEGLNIIMVHELLRSMKQENMDVSSIEEEIIGMPRLATWTFREVAQKLGSVAMKNISFVPIRMNGSPFRTQPIPTIDGGYCILASDAVFELLTHMILIKKIFQVIKMDQMDLIKNFFESLKKYFINPTSFYFVNTEVVTEAKKDFDIFFEKNRKNFDMEKATSLRNLKDVVFTKDDIRKELKHLNLDRFFPKIDDVRPKGVAEMHTTILNMQIEMAIPVCPLLTSIFYHQMTSNLPQIASKNENEANETTDNVNADESSSVVEPESQISDSSEDELKKEEDSDDSTKEPTAHPEETEKKTKRSKKSKKTNSEDVPIPPKESQSCPKCIRASEYTTKTNEKLRLSKIDVKHLKKELSVVELALEEKNERIRILEEKLREKDAQLIIKNSEVESLRTKNERNERLIATFREVTSKKDAAIKSLQCQNFEKDKLIEELKLKEYKATPPRPTEESEKVDSLLSNLLETKTILSKEDPVKKSSDICDALISKDNSKVTQQLVKYETKVFQIQVSFYSQIVESNIKLIQGNNAIKFDQIPEVPDFPEFSEEFKDVHKSILKKEAPLLCRQLLKLSDEIADMECVIYITDMESHDDTTKCAHCKRRYHNDCIKSWLKKKSICPTCKHGMVDEQEFPAL